jgi:hypothetical protein
VSWNLVFETALREALLRLEVKSSILMVFGDLLFLMEEALVAWVLGVCSGLKEEMLSFSLRSGVRMIRSSLF